MNEHIGSSFDSWLKDENISFSKEEIMQKLKEECFDFLQNIIEKPNKELLLKQVKSICEQGIKEGVIEKDYDVYIPKRLPRKLKKKLKKQGAILIQGYYRPIT